MQPSTKMLLIFFVEDRLRMSLPMLRHQRGESDEAVRKPSTGAILFHSVSNYGSSQSVLDLTFQPGRR